MRDEMHPFGDATQVTMGPEAAPVQARGQILLAVNPRQLASVLLVLIGAVLGCTAAWRVSFTLFLAVAAVLCLGIGFALGFETPGRDAEEG